MVELTWSQSRTKLLTRIGRLDHSLAQRAEQAQARLDHISEQVMRQEEELHLINNAALEEGAMDVTEESLSSHFEEETPVESSVPDYLR